MRAVTALQARLARQHRHVETTADLMTGAGTWLLPAPERRALRRVIPMLEINRLRLVLATCAGTLGLASAVALAATSAWLIARASQMPPVMELSVAAVGVRFFAVSRTVLRYVERLASHDVALRGMTALRRRVYDELAAAPADAVAGLRRGDLLARTGQDVDAVGDVVVRAILPAAVASLVSLGSVALVGWLHAGVGAVLAGCLLIAGVAGPWWTMRGARLDELAQVHQHGELAAIAESIVTHSGELSVAGRLPAAFERLHAVETDLARLKDAAARPMAVAAGINTLALGLALLGAVVIGVPAVASGQLEHVELAVVVLTPLAAFEGTALLPAAAVQLLRSAGSARRIIALLDAAGSSGTDARRAPEARPADEHQTPEPRAGEGPHAPEEHRGGAAAPPPLLLRARDLATGWPGRPVAVAGVDLDLRPGRAVAIVGPSGIGKTTLLTTLAGLLPPRRGHVHLITGHPGARPPAVGQGVTGHLPPEAGPEPRVASPIESRAVAALERSEVSDHVVLTTEDAHVFATTILENLRVARGDLSDTEALGLLTRAGLGAWVAALPDGVHTRLGGDAVTISGGERRRLLLARALASRARLLLIDEPGEHLDATTADALVTDLLRTAAGDRSVVLVTHRLVPLTTADEVLVLGREEPGAPARVMARGSHDHLVETWEPYRWTVTQQIAEENREPRT